MYYFSFHSATPFTYKNHPHADSMIYLTLNDIQFAPLNHRINKKTDILPSFFRQQKISNVWVSDPFITESSSNIALKSMDRRPLTGNTYKVVSGHRCCMDPDNRTVKSRDFRNGEKTISCFSPVIFFSNEGFVLKIEGFFYKYFIKKILNIFQQFFC